VSQTSDLQRLKSRLGPAIRDGRRDDELALRQALRVGLAERDLRKQLAGSTLTDDEADRLIAVVEEHCTTSTTSVA
jgi:hypothetical protein